MRRGNSLRFFGRFFILFIFSTLLVMPATARSGQNGAEDVVRRMNNALLECMKRADEIGFKGRYEVLSPVIEDVFALPFMGQSAMGGYWKGLTPEQKKQYLAVYADWTVSSYAGNFDGYSGEVFDIRGGQGGPVDKITVVSSLVRPKEDPIDFHYSLRRFKEKWRIVDITIEGVSQLTLTRGQFVAIMKKRGFDGLMETLKDKVDTLKNRHVDEQ